MGPMVDRLGAGGNAPSMACGPLSGARLLAYAAQEVWQCNRGMFWKAGKI
jgi:hypothetical protein